MSVVSKNRMKQSFVLGIGILLVASSHVIAGNNGAVSGASPSAVQSTAVTESAEKKPPTKTELQRLYMDYLSSEGYKPDIDSDGDVRFKHEGKTYFIDVSERDPEFFRIVLANVWRIDDEQERSQVLAAADKSNALSKVTKVFTVNDRVWVSIELFVAHPEDFRPLFSRAMSALDNGLGNFVTALRDKETQ
ncbi:T3SS (YopN, CesT) and YbjN peptide-binding chaperone 1 [Candidatus Symbiobacter mobilis]|uniref:TY-Chap central domain-containing protein n=1 Tax=Candidatus Symbiobacter mobilis CR TaxID=946483 RepID=U5N8K3_9BURK|nr:hypothetical protein [Candidatus Symbiobacter mobilis]AGX87737.1 hypothetical protein Cenrod_1652 [Candidatus Symbiobacter mobilis CR]